MFKQIGHCKNVTFGIQHLPSLLPFLLLQKGHLVITIKPAMHGFCAAVELTSTVTRQCCQWEALGVIDPSN